MPPLRGSNARGGTVLQGLTPLARPCRPYGAVEGTRTVSGACAARREPKHGHPGQTGLETSPGAGRKHALKEASLTLPAPTPVSFVAAPPAAAAVCRRPTRRPAAAAPATRAAPPAAAPRAASPGPSAACNAPPRRGSRTRGGPPRWVPG